MFFGTARKAKMKRDQRAYIKRVFPDEPTGHPLDDGRRFRLTKRFRCRLHEISDFMGLKMPREQRVIVVPAGFVTDWASIPRFLWRVFPPWDRHMRAALVHDYIYKTAESGVATRKEGDLIFRKLMKVLVVIYAKRWAMWSAVRAIGWKFFRKEK